MQKTCVMFNMMMRSVTVLRFFSYYISAANKNAAKTYSGLSTMNYKIKAALLGGDMRQSAAARFLSESGLECAVWGMDPGADIGGAVRCDDWRSAINGAAVVILPLPASFDGVRVNCPMSPDSRLRLSVLLEAVSVPVLGGRLPDFFVRSAEEKEVKIYDYFDSEELKTKNALPTAEGAVSIAMQELDRTVNGCRAAVLGYGRVGGTTAGLLHSMGADVTVAARRRSELARAGICGMRQLHIDPEKAMCGMGSLTHGYDLIINTIPSKLLSGEILHRMSPDTVIIDLASVPGGIDLDTAGKLGLNVTWALSLPGKYAPVTAGVMIGETVLSYLESEGVIGEQ